MGIALAPNLALLAGGDSFKVGYGAKVKSLKCEDHRVYCVQ